MEINKRNRVENLEMDPNTSQNVHYKKRHFKLVLNQKDKFCVKVVFEPLDRNMEKTIISLSQPL